MSFRDAMLLRAAALWTVFIWATRIVNIMGDNKRSFVFKAGHSALALVSVLFALGIWTVASRNRRHDRRDDDRHEHAEQD